MDRKIPRNPADQTRSRYGLPTPSNSTDDYGTNRRSSIPIRPTSRRTSANAAQTDRSNTTSPESVSSPLRNYGTIYEEPQRIDNAVVPVQPNPARGNDYDADYAEYSRWKLQRAEEARRAQNAAYAAASIPQQNTLPSGHFYKSITISGGAKAVTGDVIEEGTNPNLLRRHTYDDIKVNAPLGREYPEAQESRRSPSNLFAGNIHVQRGGANSFFANWR